jgi:hypothetical protein
MKNNLPALFQFGNAQNGFGSMSSFKNIYWPIQVTYKIFLIFFLALVTPSLLYAQCILEGDWTAIPATCPDASNGTLCCDTLYGQTPGTGLPPYTCQILSPAGTYTYNSATNCFQNLAPNSYTIQTTSIDGCIGTFTNIVVGSYYNEIEATTVSMTPASCGGSNGAICVNVTGGSGNFTYSWTGPPNYNVVLSNTLCLSGVPAGIYQLFVDDISAPYVCDRAFTRIVGGTTQLQVAPTIVQPTCPQGTEGPPCSATCNGAISLSVSGGTAPFTYTWTSSNGFTSSAQNISNLCDGTYNITVTDANGCTFSGSYILGMNIVYDVNGDVIVTVNTTWNSVAPYGPVATINGNIIINPGVTLTMNGITVELSRGKAIRTLGGSGNIPGAILDATNCTFTSAHPTRTWRGFEVLGVGSNPTTAQITASNRSLLWLKSCTVTRAETGIRNKKHGIACNGTITYATFIGSSGRVLCENSTFRTNVLDVNFHNYVPQNELGFANSELAKFNNCTFEHNEIPSCREILSVTSAWERIKLKHVTGVYFYSCQGIVTNTTYTSGSGTITKFIAAYNSWFDWRGCDMNNQNCDAFIRGFYQGISVNGNFNTIFTDNGGITPTFTNVDMVLLIDRTEFECAQGVYMSGNIGGLSSLQVLANDFFDTPASYGNTPASSLENTRVRVWNAGVQQSRFYINANTFHTTQPWILPEPNAINITNGGTENNNFIYLNAFVGFNKGIIAFNANRDPTALSDIGLHYECNDFTDCKYDIYLDMNGLNAANKCAARMQSRFWLINDPSRSAGNRFNQSLNSLVSNDDIFRQSIGMGVIPQNNPDQTYKIDTTEVNSNILTELSYIEISFDNENLNTSRMHILSNILGDNITAHTCPGTFVPPVVQNSVVPIQEARDNYNDQLALVELIRDGGNSGDLLSKVQWTNYSNALQTYQALMQNSPELSYEVMIAAIEKENEIPTSWLTNILASNPHATRSVDLVSALNNRSIPLDEYQVNLIVAASANHYTPLQVAETLLSYYRYQEVEARANFANCIAQNSSAFETSDFTNLYNEEQSIGERVQKANLLLEVGDITGALDLLYEAPLHHKLNSEELQILEDVQDIIRLEHDILTVQNGELTTEQQQLLEGYWLNDPYGAGPEALRILLSLTAYTPHFIDLNEDYALRSAQVQKADKTLEWNTWPNPATEYILIRRNGSELPKGIIQVFGIDGREVLSESIQNGQLEKTIWIESLPAGEYLLTVRLDDKTLVERKTFIKL